MVQTHDTGAQQLAALFDAAVLLRTVAYHQHETLLSLSFELTRDSGSMTGA